MPGQRKSIVDKIRKSKAGEKKDDAKKAESRKSLVRASQVSTPADMAAEAKSGGLPELKLNLPVCPKELQKLQELQDWKGWGPFKKLANSQYFETYSAIGIISFAGFVGAEVEYMARNPDANLAVFIMINNGFNVWFGVELLCRMLACNRPCIWKFFVNKDWKWNWFDFLMVCSFFFELIGEIAYNAGPEVKLFIKTIKVFRIIRIIRILKILRFLRNVKEIKKMVGMIVFSSRMLIMSLIIVASMHYIFAVVFVRATVDYTQLDDSLDPDAVVALLENFGTLERSIYSLFKSITGGQNWHELADPLLEIHWTYGAAFMFFVSFTLWTVFNILTSVFVDANTRSVQKEEEMEVKEVEETKDRYEKSVEQLFQDLDKDGTGNIDSEEFAEALKDPRMEAYLEVLEMDPEHGTLLFKLLDYDQSGMIDTKEFIDGCNRIKGVAKAFDIQTLMYQQGKIMCQMKGMEQMFESKLNDIKNGVGDSGLTALNDKNDDTREAVQRRLKRLFLVATTPQLLKCESDLQDAIEKAYNDKKAWKQDQLATMEKKRNKEKEEDDGKKDKVKDRFGLKEKRRPSGGSADGKKVKKKAATDGAVG
mmetsp:Transcript_98977/g.171517  ORF Transcript_98977/g.171517 Transcript_98977/m.171517 type:complete len:593 (+) Transcript_98977:172-1950(+)